MFLNPSLFLTHISLHPHAKVGDFGAGAGDYALPIAEKLSDGGTVYAFDVVPEVVERLKQARAHRVRASFIPLCVDLNKGIPLRDELLDVGVLINTLSLIREREFFLRELHRVLGRGNAVLFAEWAASFNNMGPRAEDVISPGDAVRLFQAHGFSVGAMLPAGSHHFAFVAKKQ